MERHLDTCPDCRRVLAELAAVRTAAMELEQLEPSPETWRAIRRRVMPERRLRQAWIWAGAAAVAATLVAVVFLGRPGPDRQDRLAAVATAAPEAARELGEQYDDYLRGIDAALDEIRTALDENPGNTRVRMALYRAHQSRSDAMDRMVSGGY